MKLVMASKELPEPMNLWHHLSEITKARHASNIKDFYKYFSIPGIGQLAGGLPNDHYFPFDTLEAKAAFPDRWKPTPNDPVKPPPTLTFTSQNTKASEPESAHILVPKTSNAPDKLRKIDLATALQYGTAEGYPPLYQWIKRFTTEHMHPSIPYKGGVEVVLTSGNTDGFSKAIEALNNPWVAGRDPVEERESILCEEYAYMGAIYTVKPRGMNVVAVAIDEQGMVADGPGGVREILENWDYSKGKRPSKMYTVTIGQNPTSGILSMERRKAIYALCVQYDIIIIEDEPYWFLQYPSSATGKAPRRSPFAKSSGFDFLDSLVPSYLSIDYQGRVIRLDTFSKTIAPGCRLGWITAQPMFVERILRITETAAQQPSGFVQSMVAELIVGPFDKHDGGTGGRKDGNGWGFDGWVRWLEGLRGNYERRMNTFCDAIDKGNVLVKAGRRESIGDEWSVVETTKIFDYTRPMGGMFVWIRFNFATHPLAKSVSHKRLSRALWVFWTKKPHLVLVAPGTIFATSEDVLEHDAWKCFRISFAACDEEQLGPFGKRFADGAQAFWRIKSKAMIDELLKDDNDSNDALMSYATDPALGKLTWIC